MLPRRTDFTGQAFGLAVGRVIFQRASCGLRKEFLMPALRAIMIGCLISASSAPAFAWETPATESSR